jgi:hypothetical protein
MILQRNKLYAPQSDTPLRVGQLAVLVVLALTLELFPGVPVILEVPLTVEEPMTVTVAVPLCDSVELLVAVLVLD